MGGKSSKVKVTAGGILKRKKVGGGETPPVSFKMFQRVRVVGPTAGAGKRGEIVDVAPSGKFYVVRFGGVGAKTRSYHESNLVAIKTRKKK